MITAAVSLTTPYRRLPDRVDQLKARAVAQRQRQPGFTVVPAKRRLSTRGLRSATWQTKKNTPSRLRDMAEAAA